MSLTSLAARCSPACLCACVCASKVCVCVVGGGGGGCGHRAYFSCLWDPLFLQGPTCWCQGHRCFDEASPASALSASSCCFLVNWSWVEVWRRDRHRGWLLGPRGMKSSQRMNMRVHGCKWPQHPIRPVSHIKWKSAVSTRIGISDQCDDLSLCVSVRVTHTQK